MSTHPRRINCTACGKQKEVRYSVDAATYVCGACGKSNRPLTVASDDPSWRREALCAPGTGNEFAFDDAAEGDQEAVREAKEVCAACPVRQRCLDAAMATEHGSNGDARWSVRGGRTGRERYRLYRRLLREAAAA